MAEADLELDDDLEVEQDLLTEDDEELEADDVELEVEEPEQKKPLSRGQREIVNLRKRAQAAEDRASRAEELGQRNSGAVEALTRQGFQTQTAEQQRIEQERIAAMTDEEKRDHFRKQDHQHYGQALAQSEFRTMDRLDKQDFREQCRDVKAYADVADEVERRLVEMRKNNVNVDRAILADKVIGERVVAKARKGVVVEKPRKRVVSSGSDVPRERGDTRMKADSPEARHKRLEGKVF